jgi:hypothetical protein
MVYITVGDRTVVDSFAGMVIVGRAVVDIVAGTVVGFVADFVVLVEVDHILADLS